jgi:Flp pilus assembly protein TadD
VLGLAHIAKIHGRYSEAIAMLTELIAYNMKNSRFYLELADCYICAGDLEMARVVLISFQRLGIRSNAVNDMLKRLMLI